MAEVELDCLYPFWFDALPEPTSFLSLSRLSLDLKIVHENIHLISKVLKSYIGFMNENFAIIILSHTYFVDLTNFVVTEVVVFDD